MRTLERAGCAPSPRSAYASRAYGANTVAGGDLPTLKHGQILVAHVELGADGPLVVALETHGVTTKNPAIQPRKASKKH